jgi:uncharacterized protein with NRDE domain
MFKQYPLIVAANRDEHYDRPSAPPTRWSTEPKIIAGKDLLAGGTWLGVNEHGVLAGIVNRRLNSEQDAPVHTRSRGLFCLDLLSRPSAAEAREFTQWQEETYQPFTALFADRGEAWVAYNIGREVRSQRLHEGLHVLSNAPHFDIRSEKIDRAYLRFAQFVDVSGLSSLNKTAMVRSLRRVLGDHTLGNGSNDPKQAICVHGDTSGTVSSTIVIYSQTERRFYVFDCPGPPCQSAFGEALGLDLR